MSKSKKIIKVVDIVADDDDIEPYELIVDIENSPVDIETGEVTPEAIPPSPIKNELKTTVKTSDLTECEKCHKMIMNKTLKYSHFKTCGIVKIAKTPIEAIAPIAPIEAIEPVIKRPIRDKSVSAIKQVKKPIVIKQQIPVQPQPPPIITLDQMRTEYFNNVKQQRTMMMQKLFSNAI
jgi:hypothetical protein